MDLKGKNAIITGGGRGIGAGIATSLAQEGVNVGLIARSTNELESVANSLIQYGINVTYAIADISKRKEVNSAVTKIKENLGEINFLINNAGIGNFELLTEQDPDDWERVIQVNLMGTYYMIHAVLPDMIKNKTGTIVNISSGGGMRGIPYCSAYCASKFGVMGLSESLMPEVHKYNIRVGTLALGQVNTELIKKAGVEAEDWDSIMDPSDVGEYVLIYLKLPEKMYIKNTVLSNSNPQMKP